MSLRSRYFTQLVAFWLRCYIKTKVAYINVQLSCRPAATTLLSDEGLLFCSRCQTECKMPTWPSPMAHCLAVFLFPFVHLFPELFVSKGWKFIAHDCIHLCRVVISTVFLKAAFCSPCFALRLNLSYVKVTLCCDSSAHSSGKFNLGSARFVLLLVWISLRFLTLVTTLLEVTAAWALSTTYICLQTCVRHYKSSMKVFLVVVSLHWSISRWFPL